MLQYHRSFLWTHIGGHGSNTPAIDSPCRCLPGHIGTELLWLFIYILHAPISCSAMPYARYQEDISMWSASAFQFPSWSSSSWESASSRSPVDYIHYLPQWFLSAKPQAYLQPWITHSYIFKTLSGSSLQQMLQGRITSPKTHPGQCRIPAHQNLCIFWSKRLDG